MKIKPGMLCYVRNLPGLASIAGQVVKTVSFHGNHTDYIRLVVIEAAWACNTSNGERWTLSAIALVPISDPDIDVSEQDDALTDNPVLAGSVD